MDHGEGGKAHVVIKEWVFGSALSVVGRIRDNDFQWPPFY